MNRTLTVVSAGLAIMTAQDAGEPAWPAFQALAEEAIRSKLSDPQSAQFQWPYNFRLGPVGYWTCGLVNAKNMMGGYVGATFFSVVVKDGRVVNSQIADGRDHIAFGCERDVRKGRFTPRH